MIKEGSDFFQNAKFCPILDIYNSPVAWIGNSMLSCSLSYWRQKNCRLLLYFDKEPIFQFGAFSINSKGNNWFTLVHWQSVHGLTAKASEMEENYQNLKNNWTASQKEIKELQR